MTVVEEIGAYAASVRFERLPSQVVERIKILILDSLACLYGGYSSEPAELARRAYVGHERCNSGAASVIPTGERVGDVSAAVVNGVALRYLDQNDVYFGPAWTAHPSDNFAALLAVAEAEDRSGRDLVAATVVAYEVQLAFADLPVERNLWHRGWHHSAACAYASAAGCGKLYGLEGGALADAMALSGARANTLAEIRHGPISMDKALSAPLVASGGITSARLAREGFTGCRAILDGQYGFCAVVAGGVDPRNLIPDDECYRVLKVSLKPYPVEGMTISMVEAALKIRESITAGDLAHVTRIVVGTHEEAMSKPSWDVAKEHPQTKETADHSFSYCVAVALVAGQVTRAEFSDQWLHDATVRSLMAKTSFVVQEEMTRLYAKGARPASVRVEMEDGSVVSAACPYPKGDPLNPMTAEDVTQKFVGYARPYIGDAAKRASEMILSVDKIGSMTELARLLEGSGASER